MPTPVSAGTDDPASRSCSGAEGRVSSTGGRPCALSVMCARVLKAPEIALLALLEVIFGILLAWVGANEVPSQTVLAGGALVMGALVVNELVSWRVRTS